MARTTRPSVENPQPPRNELEDSKPEQGQRPEKKKKKKKKNNNNNNKAATGTKGEEEERNKSLLLLDARDLGCSRHMVGRACRHTETEGNTWDSQ